MTLLFYKFFEERVPDKVFEAKLDKLPPAMQEKTKKFWRWQDAHAALFGKLLLLEGLKKFGVKPSLVDLCFNGYGKPFLPDSPVCFNISHSGNCVVCVLSDDMCSIGVDIEEIKPVNIKGLRGNWTDDEWEEIVYGTPKVFFNYWTRKEAVLKADGRGLGIAMKEFDVRHRRVNLKEKVYFLSDVSVHENYVLHIACLKDVGNCIHIESAVV